MRPILAAFVVLYFAACQSTGEPAEHEFNFKAAHTYEFVYDQCLDVMKGSHEIESADQATGTIVSKWHTELSPLANSGQRSRVTLFVKGDLQGGYAVKAKEEAEVNTNLEAPLDPEAVDWEPAETDGSRAEQLLFKIHRRLNPPEPWRRLSER